MFQIFHLFHYVAASVVMLQVVRVYLEVAYCNGYACMLQVYSLRPFLTVVLIFRGIIYKNILIFMIHN
jgi:hypothetical protein